MPELPLSPEQEEEAQVLYERIKCAFDREAWQLARIMASKADGELLGRTEFAVRDQVHRLGAQVLEAVRQERKKRLPRHNDGLSPVPRACRGWRSGPCTWSRSIRRRASSPWNGYCSRPVKCPRPAKPWRAWSGTAVGLVLKSGIRCSRVAVGLKPDS